MIAPPVAFTGLQTSRLRGGAALYKWLSHRLRSSPLSGLTSGSNPTRSTVPTRLVPIQFRTSGSKPTRSTVPTRLVPIRKSKPVSPLYISKKVQTGLVVVRSSSRSGSLNPLAQLQSFSRFFPSKRLSTCFRYLGKIVNQKARFGLAVVPFIAGIVRGDDGPSEKSEYQFYKSRFFCPRRLILKRRAGQFYKN